MYLQTEIDLRRKQLVWTSCQILHHAPPFFFLFWPVFIYEQIHAACEIGVKSVRRIALLLTKHNDGRLGRVVWVDDANDLVVQHADLAQCGGVLG